MVIHNLILGVCLSTPLHCTATTHQIRITIRGTYLVSSWCPVLYIWCTVDFQSYIFGVQLVSSPIHLVSSWCPVLYIWCPVGVQSYTFGVQSYTFGVQLV